MLWKELGDSEILAEKVAPEYLRLYLMGESDQSLKDQTVARNPAGKHQAQVSAGKDCPDHLTPENVCFTFAENLSASC